MKVLIFGGFGLLGNDIFRVFQENGIDIIRYSKDTVNLLEKNKLQQVIHELKPEIVIHSAGFTNVELGESNTRELYSINCIGTYNLIQSLIDIKSKLIYISTDYVFDGNSNRPYNEDDIISPLNQYGWSKAISEDIIRANLSDYYIIRSSWLFGMGKCFPKTILEKLKNGEEISVIDDQYGNPTYTLDLASALLKLFSLPFGTYHLSNASHTSWYELACKVAQISGMNSDLITPIKTVESNYGAKRPYYSVLSNDKWNSYYPSLRHYEDALEKFLKILLME